MNGTRIGGGAAAGAVLLGLLVGTWGCSNDGGGDSSHAVASGDGGSDSGDAAGSPDGAQDGKGGAGSPGATPLWTELTQAALVVQGGAAHSPGGVAADGGKVHIVGSGTTTLDPSVATGAAPSVPGAPGDATTLTSDALATDVTAPGAIVIDGTVLSGGSDPVRTITAGGGDIFITGTLRGADLGGARQSLHLIANGSVFITGTLDTSGGGESGQSGGEIQITAQQVVVTGKVTSAGGEGHALGGNGGALAVVATTSIFLGGALDTFGGDGRGPSVVTGGVAGAINLKAGGDVTLAGTVRLRGGAASSSGLDAQGGAAAALTIDCDGNLQLGGTVDGRGGLATALVSGGGVAGGAAGALKVGETAGPAAIVITVPVVATGGDGDASGGQGGPVNIEGGPGDMLIAGLPAIDAGGGNSMTKGGTGGTIDASPTNWSGKGALHITGLVTANGGSIEEGGSGTGGDAGFVTFYMTPTFGNFNLDQSGKITADGGQSRGAMVAGGGGHVFLWTKDGDLTVAGSVSARGGVALDVGGQGGLGGMVYCFSDANHDAKFNNRGHLLIAPTGVVDSSGGDGSVGGNARSNGHGGVPVFPDHQEQIAIFLNCDGVHGTTLNWLDNQGHLIARGGVNNGNGGDIVYHGIAPDRNQSPPSGNIDVSGDGFGKNGDFDGE